MAENVAENISVIYTDEKFAHRECLSTRLVHELQESGTARLRALYSSAR